MGYHAVFFTDMSDKIWHARPIGAYRLASELRDHGYKVLVVDFFSKWLMEPAEFDNLLKTVITEETRFVGYSGTFFSIRNRPKTEVDSYREYYGYSMHQWPVEVKFIKKINQRIKSLNNRVKIFYGGAQASKLNANLTESGVDYVVQGLADSIIVEILDNLCNDRHIRYTPKNDCRVIDYDILGHQFDFVNSRTVFHESDCFAPDEVLPFETSRGCLFKCKFCAFPLIGRKKNDPAYHRNIEIMAEELRHNYDLFGVTKYMFLDDTFNESTEKLRQVQAAIDMSGVDIRFSCYLRLDLISRYPEQIEILKSMGMQSCYLGIETLNLKSARSIGKSSHPDWIKSSLKDMQNILGDSCTIFGSFIAGLPHETEDTLEEWMTWVYDHPELIHGFSIGRLSFTKSSFPSEIERDPGKFGYQIDSDGAWTNNMGMTQHRANEISHKWMEHSWNTNRLRISGWEAMGLQNLGYSFQELQKLTLNQLPMIDISRRYQKRFQDYKTKLFGYLVQKDS